RLEDRGNGNEWLCGWKSLFLYSYILLMVDMRWFGTLTPSGHCRAMGWISIDASLYVLPTGFPRFPRGKVAAWENEKAQPGKAQLRHSYAGSQSHIKPNPFVLQRS